MPADLGRFKPPQGVNERLHDLPDRQDRGEALTPAERTEAEGLVEPSELLSFLRLRTQRIWQDASPE